MSTSREKMQQAREFIQQKRYDEARAILRGVNHDMALDWLDKIDKLDPPAEESLVVTKSTSGRSALKTLLLIALIPVAIVAAFWIYSFVTDRIYYNQHESEASADLYAFCTVFTHTSEPRCSQWSDQTFRNDLSKVRDVLTCDELFKDEEATNPQLYGDCLSNSGIYLP